MRLSPPAALHRQTGRIGLALCLGIWPAGMIQAGTIYRCLQNGAVAFTQHAADPSCQPMDVKPYEPDPDDAARQWEALKQWRDDRSQAWREGRRKQAAKQNAAGNGSGDGYRRPPGFGRDHPKERMESDFSAPSAIGR